MTRVTVFVVFVVAAAALLGGCGPEPTPAEIADDSGYEVAKSPLVSGSYSFVGKMTCPGESVIQNVHQDVIAGKIGPVPYAKLNPWPLTNGTLYEMTLNCPNAAVLTPSSCNAYQTVCSVLAHQPWTPWAVTGSVTIPPNKLCFTDRDSIHPQGQLYLFQGIPAPHWDDGHGLCAYGDDFFILK